MTDRCCASNPCCDPEKPSGDIKTQVQARYTRALERSPGNCCGGEGAGFYSRTQELDRLPPGAVAAAFGCGNPTALATLRPGEVVLDLGSGAGIDVFLAAGRVGPQGHVYGVDMTAAMLEAARRHQAEAGLDNVTFVAADIEELPFPDESFDVVISNCVINLSPNKPKALAEAARVLRPGGRLAVTDIVLSAPLPPAWRSDPELWCACIGGALLADEYRRYLTVAGLEAAEVEFLSDYGATTVGVADVIHSAFIRARKPGPAPAYELRSAGPADVPAIEELLARAGLHGDDVAGHCGDFVVAASGVLLGCAGAEVYGDVALVRSVAVAPGFRNWGIGRRLVDELARRLQARGVRAAYLLTTGQAGFFTRAGFTVVDRAAVPAALRTTPWLAELCPAAATCLVRDLG